MLRRYTSSKTSAYCLIKCSNFHISQTLPQIPCVKFSSQSKNNVLNARRKKHWTFRIIGGGFTFFSTFILSGCAWNTSETFQNFIKLRIPQSTKTFEWVGSKVQNLTPTQFYISSESKRDSSLLEKDKMVTTIEESDEAIDSTPESIVSPPVSSDIPKEPSTRAVTNLEFASPNTDSTLTDQVLSVQPTIACVLPKKTEIDRGKNLSKMATYTGIHHISDHQSQREKKDTDDAKQNVSNEKHEESYSPESEFEAPGIFQSPKEPINAVPFSKVVDGEERITSDTDPPKVLLGEATSAIIQRKEDPAPHTDCAKFADKEIIPPSRSDGIAVVAVCPLPAKKTHDSPNGSLNVKDLMQNTGQEVLMNVASAEGRLPVIDITALLSTLTAQFEKLETLKEQNFKFQLAKEKMEWKSEIETLLDAAYEEGYSCMEKEHKERICLEEQIFLQKMHHISRELTILNSKSMATDKVSMKVYDVLPQAFEASLDELALVQESNKSLRKILALGTDVFMSDKAVNALQQFRHENKSDSFVTFILDNIPAEVLSRLEKNRLHSIRDLQVRLTSLTLPSKDAFERNYDDALRAAFVPAEGGLFGHIQGAIHKMLYQIIGLIYPGKQGTENLGSQIHHNVLTLTSAAAILEKDDLAGALVMVANIRGLSKVVLQNWLADAEVSLTIYAALAAIGAHFKCL